MLVSRALGDRNASIPYTVIDDSSENRFETVPQYYTDVAAVACSVAALLQLCCSGRSRFEAVPQYCADVYVM